MRVLVADDDPEVRAGIARALTRAGHEVDAVPDGAAALDILSRDPMFDALVTDLIMPRLDGLMLVQRLRRAPVVATLPVIAISEVVDKDLIVLVARLFIAGLLKKPVEGKVVLRKLEKLYQASTRAIPDPLRVVRKLMTDEVEYLELLGQLRRITAAVTIEMDGWIRDDTRTVRSKKLAQLYTSANRLGAAGVCQVAALLLKASQADDIAAMERLRVDFHREAQSIRLAQTRLADLWDVRAA